MVSPERLAAIPPDDYAPIDESAVPLQWIHKVLDSQTDPAIRYVVVREEVPGYSSRRYTRYYSPAAHAYLAAHPMAEMEKSHEFKAEDIAALHFVTVPYVRRVADGLGLVPIQRYTDRHAQVPRYTLPQYVAIAAEIELIPLADPTDVALPDIADDTSRGYVDGYLASPTTSITAIDKRYHPDSRRVGIVRHVTEAEAHIIRDSYTGNKIADPALHIGFTEISERSGVPMSTVMYRFDALPEKPSTHRLRASFETRPANFLDRAWGEAFTERIKPVELKPWQVTAEQAGQLFGKTPGAIRDRIPPELYSEEQVALGSGTRQTKAYSIALITHLLDTGVQPMKGAPNIDPTMLPYSEQEARDLPDKAAYARALQERLQNPDWINVPIVAVMQQLQSTPAALLMLIGRNPVSELPVGISVVAVNELRKRKHSPAPEDWVSHAVLLSRHPHLSALPDCFNTVSDRGARVSRSSHDNHLDVFYPLALARKLLAYKPGRDY
jgi:hypothetical protein